VRGDVLVAPERAIDAPVSPLVAALVRLADGTRSIHQIAGALAGEGPASTLLPSLERATRILHQDGALDLLPVST
jgi:hypothetical protein